MAVRAGVGSLLLMKSSTDIVAISMQVHPGQPWVRVMAEYIYGPPGNRSHQQSSTGQVTQLYVEHPRDPYWVGMTGLAAGQVTVEYGRSVHERCWHCERSGLQPVSHFATVSFKTYLKVQQKRMYCSY